MKFLIQTHHLEGKILYRSPGPALQNGVYTHMGYIYFLEIYNLENSNIIPEIKRKTIS